MPEPRNLANSDAFHTKRPRSSRFATTTTVSRLDEKGLFEQEQVSILMCSFGIPAPERALPPNSEQLLGELKSFNPGRHAQCELLNSDRMPQCGGGYPIAVCAA